MGLAAPHPAQEDTPADVMVELATCYVEDRPAVAGDRPWAFCVHSATVPDVLLAASSPAEYAAWVAAIRHGAPAFRQAVAQVGARGGRLCR